MQKNCTNSYRYTINIDIKKLEIGNMLLIEAIFELEDHR